jgi:hypothetical protein
VTSSATHLVTGIESGKSTSFFSTFAKVAFLFGPLKGVVANYLFSLTVRTRCTYNTQTSNRPSERLTIISYTRIPKVHQSTAEVCPHPLITSGAMYSSVPTNELVRKSAIHERVSTRIVCKSASAQSGEKNRNVRHSVHLA